VDYTEASLFLDKPHGFVSDSGAFLRYDTIRYDGRV